jgi:hypothetical protein
MSDQDGGYLEAQVISANVVSVANTTNHPVHALDAREPSSLNPLGCVARKGFLVWFLETKFVFCFCLVFSIHRKMSKAVQTANHNFPTAELW